MRESNGRHVAVNGRSVYVEESGHGTDWVVFEAGSGEGRTCWDRVLPELTDRARLVAYDRAGFGRSGRTQEHLTIDDYAADLRALINEIVPLDATLIVVAHSMGGLVSRRAAPSLGSRLHGLLLLDTTPEQAPTYDAFDRTARQVDRSLAVGQALIWFPPMARLSTGMLRRLYPRDTYRTMLAEDFTPSGLGQTRKEFQAVAAAIHQFRADPPALPTCPTTLLSPTRDLRRRGHQATLSEYQRRYIDTLPDGRFERVESAHLVQAEQPGMVADHVRALLDNAHRTAPTT